ncbi:MAG: hypothetical protein QW279_10745, partial [Candidatus Jordarchaeaceae archaeon]
MGKNISKHNKIILRMILLTMLIIITCTANAQLTSTTIIHSTGQIITNRVWAKSGYWRDIQAAIDAVAAAGGGEVYIPEGTWNFVNVGESWTGARVTIPVGVSVFGAPTERDANGQVIEWKTVLVMPWDVPGDWYNIPIWFKISGNSNPNKRSRFSDIKLVGYRSLNPQSTTVHIGVEIEYVMNFRVDHCCFEHTCGGGVSTWGLACNGVIDHCKVYNIYGYDDLANGLNSNVGYGVEIHRDWQVTF